MKTQVKTKKTQNNYNNQNPLEALKGIGTGVADAFVKDLAGESFSDAWEQFFGGVQEHKNPFSGDLQEGQELNLKKKGHEDKSEYSAAAPAIDYHREIVEVEKRASREDQQIIKSQIEEIRIELDKISKTSKEIEVKLKEVTVGERIEYPGEYHVTFYQLILNKMRTIFKDIQDSSSWLSVMQSKKKQKGYWAMFKKHGTTFGLSNERVVATQTG